MRPKTQKSCLWLVIMLATLASLYGCASTGGQPTAKEYMFWPAAPDAPHIQYLASISSSGDVTGKRGNFDEMIYGKDFSGDLPFQRPYGVRMYNGCIYVCDATSDNVSILDFRKKEVRILGRTGTITLHKPIDIAVAPDGIKYVADTGLGAVVAYDASDKYAGKISLPGMRPVSVAIYQNELYAADITASLVRVFDRVSGQPLRTIGEPGGGPGQLGGAMGIALDKDGNLYVNDVIGCKIQKFTHDGKFVSVLGGIGDRPGKLVRPKHMAIDGSDFLYVVDNAFQNVQMFDNQGRMLTFFGGPGRHPGNMNMPAGICVSDTDLDLFSQYAHPAFEVQRIIIVSNNFGPAKINIYGLGQLKPGKTPADIAAGRVQGIFGMTEQAPPTIGPDSTPLDAPSTEPAAATQPTMRPTTVPEATGGNPR